MKRLVLAGLIGAVLAALFMASPLYAASLKLQPLLYKDTLKQGEKKTGFIDVSNPTGQTLTLKTSVQAFRQVDDQGNIEFYNDSQVSAGLIPDLKQFELGPREAIRLYFLLDGTKLPSGDVFAALFVETVPPRDAGGTRSSVRLGTLFTLVNGTPGSREADVTNLDVSFFQFGSGVEGSYIVKNTASTGQSTGFYPEVTASLSPFGQQQQVASSLIFAGRARQNDFSLASERLGFYNVSVSYGDSTRSQWVFMATGRWFYGLLALILALLASVGYLWYRHRQRQQIGFSKR